MRIHTNTPTDFGNIMVAANMARAHVTVTGHGSRTHAHAFEIALTGESNRNNQSNTGKAATWDQWGVFLSVLFDRDSEMVVGSVKRPVYANRYDFDRKTNGRFAPHGTTMEGDRFTKGEFGRDEANYWPQDAHGDHKFEFVGVDFDNAIIHRCTKCSAARIHPR